jgi:Ser/Thr protein kinase RdoA (MazF antagonist)
LEKRIKERFNDTILREAAGSYGVAVERVELLDGFESFIFQFRRGAGEYILRLSHSLRRSEGLIRGEVDWINYLAAGGASVAAAIPSADGNLVECIDDGRGGQFLTTAFVKAQGRMLRREEWRPPLVERYGQLLGRMHALTKTYEPADPAWRRIHWDDPEMLYVEQFLPPDQTTVRDRYRALMAHLDGLPRDGREAYGLIHQDAHAGNLFVDEAGRITLFDFDDCTYSWFANDVAIVLFYAVMWEQDPAAFTAAFMSDFLRGYRRENRLDPRWLVEMPHFLKLREIDLYAVIYRSFDVEDLDDPWVAGYMKGRRERIEAGQPYVAFDFEALAPHL